MSALQIMRAARAHAEAHGNEKSPVFSPWEALLSGGDKDVHAGILDVDALQADGFPVVTWTVNDADRMVDLMKLGVAGLMSDRPDLLRTAVGRFNAGLIDQDGLVDIGRLDIQGHRGGRDLRPENTLPAMEVGLDNLVTTLETDTGLTADGISVLSHDPYLMAEKCRRADGKDYGSSDEVLIKNLSLAELRSTFVCDGLMRGKTQVSDLSLSPVSVAFSEAAGLSHPYVMPTVAELFDFVAFYADYYRAGEGVLHEDAETRSRNAAGVRFNIETKIDPRRSVDEKGIVYAERTADPQAFVNALAGTISARGMQDRADIQSFDFRTLLLTHEQHPAIRTIFLFGGIEPMEQLPDFPGPQASADELRAWLEPMFWP